MEPRIESKISHPELCEKVYHEILDGLKNKGCNTVAVLNFKNNVDLSIKTAPVKERLKY